MFENLKAIKKAQGISAGEKRQLVILVVLLLGLTFAAVLLSFKAQEKQVREPPMATGDPAPPMVEDPQKQTFGIPTGGPNIDMAQAALLKDATADEQRTIRPEPLGYIVAEAKINPRVWSYRDNLPVLDAEVAAQIYKAPADWRFVFFRFRGEIDVSIEEQDFGQVWRSEAPSVRNVWYGRLKLDGSDAARVTFLMPTEPTWADPNDPQPNPPSQPLRDGWMRGRGLFLQRYLSGSNGGEVPTLFFIVTDLKRDYETRPVRTLEDCELEKVVDGQGLGRLLQMRIFTRYLYRLVRYANDRAGPAGAALREREALERLSIDDSKLYNDLNAHSDDYRAKYFAGYGSVASEYYREQAHPNDAGIEEIGTTWIYTDGDRLIWARVPPAIRQDEVWPPRTRIYYEGYFYKWRGYPTKAGTWRRAPELVLTRLAKVRPPEGNPVGELVFACAFVAGIALIVWFIVRDDKTKRDYRKRHRSSVVLEE